MNIELHPFRTPNFIIQKTPAGRRQDGFTEAPKYSIGEVDAETLSVLCDQFRAEIFEKAGKQDPKRGRNNDQ